MDFEKLKLMAFYDSVDAYKGILIELMSKQPLNIKDLKAENTALVIIDMVNGFCRKGNLYSPRVECIIDNVVRTFNICKDKGMQIIAFADSHTESSPELAAYPEHCMKGTWESEVIEELSGDFIKIEKNSTNGFLEKEFQDWLKENKHINNVIVVGDCTDICIEQFANTMKAYFNMNNINSRVIVPIDAVDTYDLGSHNADLLSTISLYIMAGNGIELVQTIN